MKRMAFLTGMGGILSLAGLLLFRNAPVAVRSLPTKERRLPRDPVEPIPPLTEASIPRIPEAVAEPPSIVGLERDPKALATWLLSLPPESFASLVGTPTLDRYVGLILGDLSNRYGNGDGPPVEVSAFLEQMNERIQTALTR